MSGKPLTESSSAPRKRSALSARRMQQLHWQRLLTMAVSSGALVACDDGRQNVYVAIDPYSCQRQSGLSAETCELAYRRAMAEAALSAPRYQSREECEQEFGQYNCNEDPYSSNNGSSSSGSGTTGFTGGGGYGSRSPGANTPSQPPRYQPRMTGFIVDADNIRSQQAWNPVFTHTDSNGNMKLVTADAEALTPGKGEQMRVGSRAVSTPSAGTGQTPLSRGGFGSRMSIKASFGG